jgi:hypothetical protein
MVRGARGGCTEHSAVNSLAGRPRPAGAGLDGSCRSAGYAPDSGDGEVAHGDRRFLYPA